MKTIVVTEVSTYDSYSDSRDIIGVFSVPDDVSMNPIELNAEYWEYKQVVYRQYHADRMSIHKSKRRGFKLKDYPLKTLLDWLIDHKGFIKLDYEELSFDR